ncbi:MAG: hypothetical protein QM733_22605 [Ilumatobacteraceae bacterium]
MFTSLLRRRRSAAAAVVTAALGMAAFAASPASADSGTWLVGGDAGETVGVADAVIVDNTIHIEGDGWTDGKADSDANGSWIAIKLGAAGSGGEAGILTTEPAAGQFVFPGTTSGVSSIWYGAIADDSGHFSVDVPFPTAGNTSPALAQAWAAGETHHLHLLTGSMKPTGDRARSMYLTFTIAAPATLPTLAAAAVNYSANSAAAALTGSGFTAGTVLSATLDGTAVNLRSGNSGTGSSTYTVTGTTVSGVSVLLPAGTRAGSYTVDVHGDDGGTGFDLPVTVTVNPTLAWSGGLRAGVTGTLTVTGVPTGAVVSSVTAAGITVASALAAAADTGVASGDYTVPADAPAGPTTITLTQTDPAATYTLSGTLLPDETAFNTEQFDIGRDANDPALYQGLYQSAFSTTRDALYVAAASGTGTNENGYIYKLDPDTLQIQTSVHPLDVTDPSGAPGRAPYGIGVDDVNGTVWVTNTRTATVAVYDADDLTLLKQYPNSTISHPRDAIYDPATNVVFVSSASESSSGNGLIAAFEGGDNNGNGTPYELIKNIQTGPRSVFNPVSLAVDEGTLVSPSLHSNKVAVIDTAEVVASPAVDAGSVDAAVAMIEIGAYTSGRGASGIAYDAAAQRIFIANQNSNVFVANSVTGELIATVSTGSQALNVAYDSIHQIAYVTNFGGTSVTVLDKDGNKVAALPISRANHVQVTNGIAYVVDKATPTNHAWKISVIEDTSTEPGDDQVQIVATVPNQPGGEFTWTIDSTDKTVDLGTLVQNGAYLQATGEIKPVVVTDTRTNQQNSWSVSGQVGDFTSGSATLPGSYLGWSPTVTTAGAGASPGATVASGYPTGTGLSASSVLAFGTDGHAAGSATLGAGLDLRFPAEASPGTYSALLTITAVG